MKCMIDKTRIPEAMDYYGLESVEDLQPHMLIAGYNDFCNALDQFDEAGKLENMPWWAAKTLYNHLISEAFENYNSGEDVLPHCLDVSNKEEMEWVIDLVQSWGVYDGDPNEGIAASENHFFINACASGLGAYYVDSWLEIINM